MIDCEGSNPCRIVAYGKWTDHVTSWVRVYEWMGAAFMHTGRYDEKYFSIRLAQVAQSAWAADVVPVNTRVSVAKHAVNEYLARFDYKSAIEICNGVLLWLSDTSKSSQRFPATQRDRWEALFESDVREGKALMHDLLGKSYEGAGLQADAEREYKIAQELRSRAYGR